MLFKITLSAMIGLALSASSAFSQATPEPTSASNQATPTDLIADKILADRTFFSEKFIEELTNKLKEDQMFFINTAKRTVRNDGTTEIGVNEMILKNVVTIKEVKKKERPNIDDIIKKYGKPDSVVEKESIRTGPYSGGDVTAYHYGNLVLGTSARSNSSDKPPFVEVMELKAGKVLPEIFEYLRKNNLVFAK